MRKSLPIIIVLALIVLVGGCGYNGMNSARLDVDKTWAEVQSAYQRRADLIPNLVATVANAAKFEKETYTQVALARAGQLSQAAKVPADSLTPQKMQQLQQAGSEALTAARNFIINVERYPDLKATINFTGLQDQLEGTENRIKVSRDAFSGAIKNYNQKVTSFPGNILAKILGFKEKPNFKSDAGADKAPDVNSQFNKSGL